MDVRTQLPIFPTPPTEYSQRYMADLVAALNRMAFLLANPGEGRQTTMTLTGLPGTDYGLEPGALFEVGGVVRVSVRNKAYVGGLSATGRVGTVAVTT